MTVPEQRADVVIVGGGIAGISAALAAAEDGAETILLEKAPEDQRGGNTRFSDAQIRVPHEADEFSPIGTTHQEMFDDFMHVTNGRANRDLVHVLVASAPDAIDWLSERGVSWEKGFPHTATYRRRPSGGGKAVLDALYAAAAERGVQFLYETGARTLIQGTNGRVVGVRAIGSQGYIDVLGRGGVVLACGGFQANVEMRARYLGGWAENLILRGSRYNTGEGLQMALDIGAQSAGQWGDYHSAVLDANSPRMEGGVTAIYIYQLGVIVNRQGERFLDEGEDYRDNTYVKFSKIMTQQPEGLCYCILDGQARRDSGWERGVRTITPPHEADSIEELARLMGVPEETLVQTISDYNAAVDRETAFEPDRKDGKAALGIDPPKSNWALPIEEPPYMAFAVTGGITFTFGGLRTDALARVIDTRDKVIPGLYAAGETQGEFFYNNYPGATSVLRGCVFGRIAARDAARLANESPAAFESRLDSTT
ncbi:MAG: FAD-dependent tricarballylate dehydrogenase TcuA [Chloroflexia bacterium]|jgi:tricarballylate dehydrogenase|nr:FAD-dependent tricarballylate dehydrogenase TcuA [Chloroflexia bacterium]